MNQISILYIIAVISIFGIGSFLLRSALGDTANKIKFKRKIKLKLTENIRKSFRDAELDKTFLKSGLRLTTFKYNIFRFLILGSMLSVVFIGTAMGRTDGFRAIVFLALLYFISIPKTSALGKTTPFGYVIRTIHKSFLDKKDLEFYRALTQLKNLAIAQKDNPMGADFIIEQISKFTVLTKPIFANFLALNRMGKLDEAYEYFVTESETPFGKGLAGLLTKLDSVNPIELTEQIVLFQTHIREERQTLQQKKLEIQSNLIFIPILAVPMVVLANFMYITFAIDTIKMLSEL